MEELALPGVRSCHTGSVRQGVSHAYGRTHSEAVAQVAPNHADESGTCTALPRYTTKGDVGVIPPLDPKTGYLPSDPNLEPYSARLDELEEAFVRGTADVRERGRIWSAFLSWLDRADEAHVRGRLLISGSFLSAKARPSDLDVLVLFPGDARGDLADLIQATPYLWTWQNVHEHRPDRVRFVSERIQPALGRVDAHFSLDLPDMLAPWKTWWTSEYEGMQPTGVRKGWVEVQR